MLYQSSAPLIQRAKASFGRQLRRTWTWVIVVVLLCSMVSLAAIAVAAVNEAWGWGITLAALGVATMSTFRVVALIGLVLFGESARPDLPQ